MKIALAVALLAPTLASCTSTGSFAPAKQREIDQRYVSCSLATATPTECRQRATDLCGADNYEVVDAQGLPASITDENTRIRCLMPSGDAPLGS